jgi:hypothetical protein
MSLRPNQRVMSHLLYYYNHYKVHAKQTDDDVEIERVTS